MDIKALLNLQEVEVEIAPHRGEDTTVLQEFVLNLPNKKDRIDQLVCILIETQAGEYIASMLRVDPDHPIIDGEGKVVFPPINMHPVPARTKEAAIDFHTNVVDGFVKAIRQGRLKEIANNFFNEDGSFK